MQSNYSAAKMALVGLTKTLAAEGEKYNILVNCIAPLAGKTLYVYYMFVCLDRKRSEDKPCFSRVATH